IKFTPEAGNVTVGTGCGGYNHSDGCLSVVY
ncbi:MAG: hypothetical protein RLZZ69_3496, partial [Cyanobacteriota bacterium]